MSEERLKAPFPYFGGKSRVASLVWQHFGRVDNYVEPFFGSGAILLGCSHPGHMETVNDADGLLANFWRALALASNEVARYADWPVNEADLHARHRWLVDRRSMVEELIQDPDWYDARAAGWWVWGISQWIGTGWCPPAKVPNVGNLNRKIPHVGDLGRGVHRSTNAHATRGRTRDGGLWRQRPGLGNGINSNGNGVHQTSLAHKMPFIASPSPDRKQYGLGIHGKRLSQQTPELDHARGDAARMDGNPSALYDYFRALSARLRRTRVVCGDFARILGPSVTWRHGMTAVFLDPPYADDEHAVTYAGGGQVWERVTRWCEANGDHPLLRIALCGYEDTWQAPPGWSVLRWRTSGGYGSQGNARGRKNAQREAIWFSPVCIDPANDYAGTLFEGL